MLFILACRLQTNQIHLGIICIYIYSIYGIYHIIYYFNVRCIPKRQFVSWTLSRFMVGPPHLDHLKDLVVHVAIPVETPRSELVSLKSPDGWTMADRWYKVWKLAASHGAWIPSSGVRRQTKKKHTCKLAMNSRMQSHDVILPTWKVPEYLYSVERYALLSYDSLWLSAMTMDHPRVLFAAKARWSLPVAENSLSCMDRMALEHGHSMSFHHSLLIPSHPSKDSTLELSNPCLMQIIWMSTVARSQVVPKDPSDQFLLVTNMSCVPSQ